MGKEQVHFLSQGGLLSFITQLGLEKQRADVIRRGFALVEFLPDKARTKAVTRFIYTACSQDKHWPALMREGFGNFPPGAVTQLLASAFDEEARWLTLVNQVALGYFRDSRDSVGAFLTVMASLGESQLNQRWVPVMPQLLKRCDRSWFQGRILKRKGQSVALNSDIQALFGPAIADIAFNQGLESCLLGGETVGLPGETDVLATREKILIQLSEIAQGKTLTAIDLEPRRLLIDSPMAIGY